MDFVEILRVIRKRWYITLPGAVLAVALTVVAYLMVPTKYQSHVTFALINSPRPVTAPGNGNPFLTFESSLTATADFLARSLTAEEAARELKTMGVTEEYTAALADNAMGPFITLTVTGTNRTHVRQSTGVLADYAVRKLREIQQQSGAPENSMIRAATIIPPQPPEPVIKKKVEIILGVAGLMLTITFVVAFAAESLARTRRRATRPTSSRRASLDPPSDQTMPIMLPLPRPADDVSTSLTSRASLYRGASARQGAKSESVVEG